MGWPRSRATTCAPVPPTVMRMRFWLGRQREALGEERFREILREHLNEEAAGNVLRMLEEPPGRESVGEAGAVDTEPPGRAS